MPANVVKTARDEHLWNRAKQQAEKQGRTRDYAYVMGIFQRMKGEKSMVHMLAGGEDELRKAKSGGPFIGPKGGKWADSTGKNAAAREAIKILEGGGSLEDAKTALEKRTIDFNRSDNLMDEFDKLEKAAMGGKIIGRTSDGKEVYAHNGGDVLQKQQTKKAVAQAPSKTNAQAPAYQENTLDKNQEEPAQEGTHEHHRDQALAHLQAAQAHARAAHSAKKVDQAKEHNEVVGEARRATEVTAKMPPKEVRKSMSKNNLNIDLSAEDYILKGLEEGSFNPEGQAAGIREDGRHRLHGMQRMEKGVIYPGELMGVPRGGDNRESAMRAVEDAEGEYLDFAGNRGQGGLAEWFMDAWGGQPNVNVPAGLSSRGWQKSEPPTTILDDSTPMNRQMHRSDDQISVMMAHQGEDRGLKR